MWYLLILGAVVLGAQPGAAQSGSEGTLFAFALPPTPLDVQSELILTSRVDTVAILRMPFVINQFIPLSANEPTNFLIDAGVPRTLIGIETKGMLVVCPDPITVHLANAEFTGVRNPDATILRPIDPEDVDEHFVISYSPGANSNAPAYRPFSFFMVVAATTEDPVDVEVWHRDEDGDYFLADEFTLDVNQVFTKEAGQLGSSDDYSGTMITSTRSVAVYSGHGCTRLPDTVPDTETRYVFESMPHGREMGTLFSTVPYHFGWQMGYVVRVLSTVDGTILSIPAVGVEQPRDAGEWEQFAIPANRQGAMITCSEPCIVAQFANQATRGASPGLRHMNPFMLSLTPLEQFSTNVTFATPSLNASTVHALTINVDFFPVDDLFLDEMSLADLDWQPSVGSTVLYHSTVDLDMGLHNLKTLDPDHRFAAYLHASNDETMLDGNSFGYPVGYGVGNGNGNATSLHEYY